MKHTLTLLTALLLAPAATVHGAGNDKIRLPLIASNTGGVAVHAAGLPASPATSAITSAQSMDRWLAMETKVRKKFDHPVEGRPCSANDPAYAVVYTESQKQSQRFAAQAMIAELDRAAKSSNAPRHFIIPPGIYRVGEASITLATLRDFTIHAPDAEDHRYNHPFYAAQNCRDMTYESIRSHSGGGAFSDHGTIRDNRIVNPGTCQVEGNHQDQPIFDLYAAICLDAVSHAAVTGNEIAFGNPRCQRAFFIEPNCDTLHIENNQETK